MGPAIEAELPETETADVTSIATETNVPTAIPEDETLETSSTTSSGKMALSHEDVKMPAPDTMVLGNEVISEEEKQRIAQEEAQKKIKEEQEKRRLEAEAKKAAEEGLAAEREKR